MLDWLLRRRTRATREHAVWMTVDRKLDGTARTAQAALAQGRNVVVAAHFTSTIELLTAELDASGVPWEMLLAVPVHAGVRSTRSAYVLHADLIDPAAPPATRREGRCLVLAAELHPLAARTDRVASFAAALPFETLVEHHVSLDDALMKPFATSRTSAMLAALGMSENDPLRHTMLDRSIIRAQARLAGAVTGDRPAESAEAWIEINCA